MRWWRRLWRGAAPLVLETQGPVHIEGDDRPREGRSPDRAAIVAHWASSPRVNRSTSRLVTSLLEADYEVVLASSAEGEALLDWVDGRPERVTVLRRPNLGYDFGSWATALDRYPDIAEAPEVILVNDSLAGPFAPIDHLLDHFTASAASVWGLTDTTQFCHHLQSYFLGFKRGTLLEAPVRRFWRSIRAEPSRDAVIWNYELGLSNLLRREHVVFEAAVPYWRVVGDDRNPTILGWRRLLELGVPFVKRQLLREPQLAPDGADAPAEIRRRFGVDVDDWL